MTEDHRIRLLELHQNNAQWAEQWRKRRDFGGAFSLWCAGWTSIQVVDCLWQEGWQLWFSLGFVGLFSWLLKRFLRQTVIAHRLYRWHEQGALLLMSMALSRTEAQWDWNYEQAMAHHHNYPA